METRKIYPISKVDHEDTKIELSCRNIKPIFLYFNEKYGYEALEEFIYDTKMNLDFLEDSHNWVSFDYYCRLLAKLVEYTGDPNVPFIVGTYAAKKQCYGAIENIVKRLASPQSIYKIVVEITPRYSKIGEIGISDLKKNSCIITVRYFDKYKQDKNNCLNFQGIFASFPTLWGLPLAGIEHTLCAVNKGNTCIYKISWNNRPKYLFELYGIISGIFILCILKFIIWKTANLFVLSMIPLVGYLIGIIKNYKTDIRYFKEINEKETKNLLESMETIEKMNIDLQNKIEQRTEELKDSNKKLHEAMEEIKQSQNKLLQSEKMASVGRLAAGMAHEFNNPMGAVRNYIQDILEDTPAEDPRWERLKKAEKATGRCKNIVNDLLSFARESKDIKMVDINNIIETAILNANEDITNQNIKILKFLAPDLPEIKIDEMQMRQVIMNILMNACDAIKKEGRIIIKTLSSPENIFIEISDTGEGIPEDIKNKIFDPFFTTKSPGKGIGLGLAISYNIIKRLNGDIHVESSENKGTTFKIILPLNTK
ncbi:hypothetical protein HY745_04445 [Candidatus Desantisbacteria bacterium]|nr:hypothetical protein [Candidatus Desantisbacteria bacterium]